MSAQTAAGSTAAAARNKGDDLYKAILSLRTVPEARRFFRDLLTDDELSMLSRRWQVVSMLSEGLHYREIEERTGMSSRTVARIARWFKQGPGGYRIALARGGRKKK